MVNGLRDDEQTFKRTVEAFMKTFNITLVSRDLN
jgi:hypothetical protein